MLETRSIRAESASGAYEIDKSDRRHAFLKNNVIFHACTRDIALGKLVKNARHTNANNFTQLVQFACPVPDIKFGRRSQIPQHKKQTNLT